VVLFLPIQNPKSKIQNRVSSAVSPNFLLFTSIYIISHVVNKACDAAPTRLPKFYTLHVQAVTKPTYLPTKILSTSVFGSSEIGAVVIEYENKEPYNDFPLFFNSVSYSYADQDLLWLADIFTHWLYSVFPADKLFHKKI
jgi:hypothetical protein